MKSSILYACAGLLLLPALIVGAAPQDSGKKGKAMLTFAGVKYLHRFSKDDLHEYTPDGQEDLNKFKDMFTINYYPNAKDGDGLASMANGTLENYKAAKAMVLKTNSTPRTTDKPAEHLIAVLFPQPTFIEAAFARFRMHKGVGTSVVYSHRIYGKAGNAMSDWLKKNGADIEKKLMAWNGMPAAATPK